VYATVTLAIHPTLSWAEVQVRVVPVGALYATVTSLGWTPSVSAELAAQRFAFTARMIVAAGYAGWVLLVDEVELIGRYSFMPRARSYAALARWAGLLEGEACPGLLSVFAITADFAAAVLDGRNDAETVPGKLRASGLDPERLLAAQAERGMRLIARESLHLRPPDRQAVAHTREQVRTIHGRAYRWTPPPLDADDDLTLRMRQHVRRWINEWDLKRADPSYVPHFVVSEIATDYSERPDLEAPPEDEANDQPAPPPSPEWPRTVAPAGTLEP